MFLLPAIAYKWNRPVLATPGGARKGPPDRANLASYHNRKGHHECVHC